MSPIPLRKRVLSLLIFLYPLISFSQTTGYSGTGANIDVKYHRAQWSIDPDAGKYISGTVTTYFLTKQSNVSVITFDLNKASFNNSTLSVSYHGSTSGVSFSFPSSGANQNILRITLPSPLGINVLDSVSITYGGTPPDFNDYGEGFQRSYIASSYAIYTLSESYGDEDWWPCKADMQDKIDSMDFIITTPSAFRAATNGVLTNDIISGSNRIMTYKHRHPIPSYLVAIGVAKYRVFNRTPVNVNGTSVPIVYYIYEGRGTNPSTQLTAMDFCRQEMIAFSEKFGDYPFKDEKYGMYEFGWSGGMEHQTFSAMGWSTMSSWSVIAHELVHQWFGNKVTFATWNHLWLAEGFAKYGEALAAELVPSLSQNPVSHRSGIKSTALSTSGTPIYLSATSIANSNNMWSGANSNAVYQRGAMVVSMLRKIAGDTKFYQALRNYLNDPALAYGSATTDDLKNHFEAVLNMDLDPFFTDYIYGTGNPAYDISWGNSGTGINIELTTQRKSSGSTVSYFRTPIVLRISNGSQDTSVVIFDHNNEVSYVGYGGASKRSGKVLGYTLSFVPTTVTVDPFHETMVRRQDGTGSQSTVTKVTRLNVSPFTTLDISFASFKGEATPNGNNLNAIITSTSDNISLFLERSGNGVDFENKGAMHLVSSSGNIMRFQFEDRNPVSGLNYYRVRSVDEKGIVKFSKIIQLNSIERIEGLSINPNPAKNKVLVKWNTGSNSAESVVVVAGIDGRVIYEQKTRASQVTINTTALASGVYSIYIRRNQIVEQKGKLIISR